MLSPSSRARSYTIRIAIAVSARRNASSAASPFRWRSRELTQIISHLAHRLGVGIAQLRYGCEAFRWCLSFARYEPFVALTTNSPISTARYCRDEHRYSFPYITACIYDHVPEDWTRLSSPHQFPTRSIGLALGKVFPTRISLRSRIVTDSRSIGVSRTCSQSYHNRIFVIRAGTSAEIRTHLHLKATPDHRPHTTLHSTSTTMWHGGAMVQRNWCWLVFDSSVVPSTCAHVVGRIHRTRRHLPYIHSHSWSCVCGRQTGSLL